MTEEKLPEGHAVEVAPTEPQPRPDFYQNLRAKTHEWLTGAGRGFQYAEVLLLAPDVLHLLSKLALDRRVPVVEKAKIAAAIAYFVSPVDLLPEGVVGPWGYLEDVALGAYVLNGLINAGHGDLAREHWAGQDDLLASLQHVLGIADKALGPRIWGQLKRLGDR